MLYEVITVAVNLFQRTFNIWKTPVHANGVHLHNYMSVVVINDQSRQVVAFAMHQAVHVILAWRVEPQHVAQVICRNEALVPEFFINGNIFE